MQTIWNENQILLHGRAAEGPTLSHTSHAERYYTFPMTVTRLSGTPDQVNVILPAALLEQCPVAQAEELTVRGEVRSFNNRTGMGSRLVITVYARELLREEGQDENRLHLTGTICKEPICRRTPLGRDICDLMLAVNRRYGRTDYLPCITWGSLAQRCALLSVGQRVTLDGRLQSRSYTKRLGEQSQERTAYEVSVMSLDQTELCHCSPPCQQATPQSEYAEGGP